MPISSLIISEMSVFGTEIIIVVLALIENLGLEFIAASEKKIKTSFIVEEEIVYLIKIEKLEDVIIMIELIGVDH